MPRAANLIFINVYECFYKLFIKTFTLTKLMGTEQVLMHIHYFIDSSLALWIKHRPLQF